MQDELTQRIEGALDAIKSLHDRPDDVEAVVGAVVSALRRGGTLYTCGNGGSAAQASHLAEELIGRYHVDRPPYRAVCLNVDPAALTCIANDYGFEQIFSRQCEALLTPKDALVALTTSGNSPNVINALRVARDRGAQTIGLLGNDGGASRDLCDHHILIPGDDSAHVQEAHQVMIHLICEVMEQGLS